jgi:membrane fusion protein, copper/silver efflux system
VTDWRRLTYACALLLAGAGCDGREPLYYVDPMHPAYRSDKPGTAPDCGMALVPVFEPTPAAGHPGPGGGPGESTVHVSADQQRLIGARVSEARKASGRQSLRLFAQVVPDENLVYKVNVGIDGFVRELSDVTTGSTVSRHQWLATFSAPEARPAIQAYLVAVDAAARGRTAGDDEEQIVGASAGIQTAKDRLLNIGISPVQIESIGRTGIVPPTLQLAAPGPGIVLARNISAGERFERGAELYRIADLRRVWVIADLFGMGAEHVRPGIAADIFIAGRRTTLRALVSETTVPDFDPATQSLKVRLIAENPAFVLRPGMFVDVELPIELPDAITVPVDAVIDAGVQKRVFVELRPGVFEPREVETGWRSGENVEIVSGLVEGERVVVSSSFLFDSESRMRQSRVQR